MRTFIRVVISVVAGFFLMWPLGYVYGLLGWPTFHWWGLMHGSFFSAWPTLSILTYLVLGYVRPFTRVKDTPLLIVGLAWGLVLAGFLGVSSSLSPAMVYGLLAIMSATIAALSFFAEHKLGLTLLVVSPIIFFHLDFLIFLQSPRTHDFLINGAVSAFYRIRRPLIFALIGWGLGLLARVVLKRPPVTS
jgi:hypothetical protein